MTSEPWAHVAITNGKWYAVMSHRAGSPGLERQWAKDLAKFCDETITKGNQLVTVYSREEYCALIDRVQMWMPPKQQSFDLPTSADD